MRRIYARTDAIKHIPFEVMLKQKLDLPVFCLPDGSVTEHLRQTFKAFLTASDLLICPKTGENRLLYSLRHTYATFALVNDGTGGPESGVTIVRAFPDEKMTVRPEYADAAGNVDVAERLGLPSSLAIGPVAYLCRSKCSFKPPFVQKRPDFSSPKLSAGAEGYRTR